MDVVLVIAVRTRTEHGAETGAGIFPQTLAKILGHSRVGQLDDCAVGELERADVERVGLAVLGEPRSDDPVAAAAKLQRTIAGGVTATCVLLASRTASSLTTSSTAHSPDPASAGSDGATANSAVSRSRQAEGSGASSGVASGAGRAGEISTGRERGNGTTFAAAKSQGAKAQRAARRMSARRGTLAISARTATL